MQKLIRWFLINGIFVLILYDATIGFTQFSENSANLIPFLVAFLFILSIILLVIYFIIHALHDEMDRDKLIELRAKLNKKSKGWRIFDASFDMVVTLWIASFGFTFSAIFYFLHILILQFSTSVLNGVVDKLEEI